MDQRRSGQRMITQPIIAGNNHDSFETPSTSYGNMNRSRGPDDRLTVVIPAWLNMYRIAFALSLLIGGFVTASSFAAEPLVVDVWPGKTPGDVGIKGQETSRIHPEVPLSPAPGDVRGAPPLGPQLDAQRAVSLVRSRAAEWGIEPNRIGMVGFSAGGHLALATATGFAKRTYEPIDAIDAVSCRPDFAILCYPGYLKAKDKDEIWPGLHIPADTPPILLAHASDDKESYGGSNAENSAIMYLALKRAGIPAELHIFATGDHDFGVRQNEKLPSSGTQLCVNWLRSLGLLKPGASE